MQTIEKEIYSFNINGKFCDVILINRFDENHELHSFECKPARTIIKLDNGRNDSYNLKIASDIKSGRDMDHNSYHYVDMVIMSFFNKGKLLYNIEYENFGQNDDSSYYSDYDDKSDSIKHFTNINGIKEVRDRNGNLLNEEFVIPEYIERCIPNRILQII